jgi:hypothetical protein
LSSTCPQPPPGVGADFYRQFLACLRFHGLPADGRLPSHGMEPPGRYARPPDGLDPADGLARYAAPEPGPPGPPIRPPRPSAPSAPPGPEHLREPHPASLAHARLDIGRHGRGKTQKRRSPGKPDRPCRCSSGRSWAS